MSLPAAPAMDGPADDRHFHSLRVAAVQPQGDDALALSFEVPEALAPLYRFQPGQYLTLRRPLQAGATDDLRRAYSICAGPGEALRVGIRRLPGGVFSGWVHQQLQPGAVLDVMPPQGRFGSGLVAALAGRAPSLPAARAARQVLALAAGSGITPILAIVKAVLADAQAGRVTLVTVNRSAVSSMFLDELQDLKDRHLARLSWQALYTREAADTPGAGGRLDAAGLDRVLRLAGGAGRIDAALVSGPASFNDAVEAGLRAAGVAPSTIQIERFGVPGAATALTGQATALSNAQGPATATEGTAAARITVLRDGRSHRFDYLPGDDNLLAAAGRAGLDLPFSCRSGVCATCRAKVLGGEVVMARNFALADDELAAGFVLACQARPLGAELRLSFDER